MITKQNEYLFRYYLQILGIDKGIVCKSIGKLESDTMIITLWNGDLELDQMINPELYDPYKGAELLIGYFNHAYEREKRKRADLAGVQEITLPSGVTIHVSNEDETMLK